MSILPDDPPADPFELVRDWLPANDDPERPPMTLATSGQGGAPDARIVLLSGYDDRGFLLHTDARSRKAAQLAENPSVALVIYLPADAHQLVVRGRVEPVPADEAARAYELRSPYLRHLAWQNSDDFAARPLDERREEWASFAAEHPDGEPSDGGHPDRLEPPPTWLGFRVLPYRLTFWQGHPDTASRRLEYRRSTNGWQVTTLAG